MIKEVKCSLSDTIAGEGPKPLIKERGKPSSPGVVRGCICFIAWAISEAWKSLARSWFIAFVTERGDCT